MEIEKLATRVEVVGGIATRVGRKFFCQARVTWSLRNQKLLTINTFSCKVRVKYWPVVRESHIFRLVCNEKVFCGEEQNYNWKKIEP